MGCWTDERNRAISGGMVDFQTDPITKCHELAMENGNFVFAVQYKTQCFTAPDAESTYKKYGSATNCQAGVGGVWANDVYKIVTCEPGKTNILQQPISIYKRSNVELWNESLIVI